MTGITKWIAVLAVLVCAGGVYVFSGRAKGGADHRSTEALVMAEGRAGDPDDPPSKGEASADKHSVDKPEKAGKAEEKEEAKDADEAKGKEKDKDEDEGRSWVVRGPHGKTSLALDHETQERIGLTTQALEAVSRAPEVVAYGQLEADPARSFTVHAALSGYLHLAPDAEWPEVGAKVEDGAVLGLVKPRFSAMEKFDLSFKLAEARADVQGQLAQVNASRAAYRSKKELSDGGKLVSDRVLEEAEAKLKMDEARLKAAQDELELIEGLVARAGASAESVPLPAAQGGEVVEVLARPGEAVESGQPLLRLARYDRMIARVEIPAGDRVDTPITSARFVVVGREDWVMSGDAVGQVSTGGVRTQGQSYLFRVATSGLPVRPGTAVTAYLTMGKEQLTGVTVPRSAVARYAGLAWVYVQTSDEHFERRPIRLASPTEAGWFVAEGVSAGDRVATTGVQVLLSEELKSQIKAEEAAAGD